MRKRSRFMGTALAAALLILVVTALTPVALASPAPSPSAAAATAPKGTPIPVGVIPDPTAVITSGNGQLWNGDVVEVNFRPNGSTLDAAKCQVYINGALQKLASAPVVQYLSPATPTLHFSLAAAYKAGKYDFRVIMVTTKGVKVEKTWTYDSQGQAGGQLVKWSVIKNWWKYIARGAIVTVELTVISILFASILALFGSLGRLSKKMTFKQAWDRYQSWGYMWRMVHRPHPVLDRDVLHVALPRDAPPAADHLHLPGDAGDHPGLRPAEHAQPAGVLVRRRGSVVSTTAPTSPRSSAPASRPCPRGRTKPRGRSA